jgi:hypothetical protein
LGENLSLIRETESLERAREAFADQFVQTGETVFYRRRGKGEPVAVSVWERDALIHDFNRRIGDLYKALVLLVMAILIVVSALVWAIHVKPDLLGVVLVLGPVALAHLAIERWIWDAPQRLIAARASAEGRTSSAA